MKTSDFMLLILLFIPSFLLSQVVNVTWKYSGNNAADVIPPKIKKEDKLLLTVSNLTSDTDFDDFVKKSSIKIDADPGKTIEEFLKLDQGFANLRTSHKIDAVDLIKALSTPPIDGKIIELILEDKSKAHTYKINIGADADAAGVAAGVAGGDDADNLSFNGIDDELNNWINSGNKVVKLGSATSDLSTLFDNESRYDKRGNRAYLIIDENGNLLGNNPVNIDQDDIIYVIMIGDKGTISTRKVDFVGTYAPVDLQMRSFAAPAISSNGLGTNTDVKVFSSSPFTSETVIIKVKNSKNTVLATYSLRINKLFHLGFGVSFNRTALEDPDFVTSPLTSTTNTIIETNVGHRNMISFNVIWYWSSTFRYLIRGSNLTRGRDVLKEPTFLERINPTFGLAFDGNVTNNLFAGLTFEFARGGSLVGGYHFGKVKGLAIPNFKLGESDYIGTIENIPTSMVSKQKLYFGILIDTRIFNTLFSRGQ